MHEGERGLSEKCTFAYKGGREVPAHVYLRKMTAALHLTTLKLKQVFRNGFQFSICVESENDRRPLDSVEGRC